MTICVRIEELEAIITIPYFGKQVFNDKSS